MSGAWCVMTVVAGLALIAVITPVHAQSDVPPARQAELRRLLFQDCGSCHGLKLTGGLGPALTPQSLASKPSAALSAIILNGVPDTPMPPWNPFLTGDEADWLVTHLKQGDFHAP